MNIYYYHPLNLTFSSAQTLQVIKDYCYLSRHNHKIFFYGFYQYKNDLDDILSFIKNYPNVTLFYSKTNRLSVKLRFLSAVLKSRANKMIVTRHYRKTRRALLVKKVANCMIFQEMHEESFIYLFKNSSKERFNKSLHKLDGVIFTNMSQILFYKKEFGKTPDFRYIVLPNGVEFEKFQKAEMCKN